MPLLSLQNPVIKKLLPVFITALSYYLAGKLALLLVLPPDYAIASWPPAGVGLAAVLLWGYKVLPGIFLAGLFIHNGTYTISSSLESPLELLIFFSIPLVALSKPGWGVFWSINMRDTPIL